MYYVGKGMNRISFLLVERVVVGDERIANDDVIQLLSILKLSRNVYWICVFLCNWKVILRMK